MPRIKAADSPQRKSRPEKSIGIVRTSPSAHCAFKCTVPSGPFASNAFGRSVTLRVVFHAVEGVGGVSDTDRCDDGSGGDDDVFFHILFFVFVSVFGRENGQLLGLRLNIEGRG